MESSLMDVSASEVFHLASKDRKWERSGFEGLEICLIRINETGGGAAFLRAASGSGFPVHIHPGGEELLVISGKVVVGDRVLEAGDYLWTPPGGIHGLECEEDALLLVSAPNGIKIVD
ncbi:MAG TPA: cupin domain-containing protein [Blastocatellia bacterium]